jgi:hypothetical protein
VYALPDNGYVVSGLTPTRGSIDETLLRLSCEYNFDPNVLIISDKSMQHAKSDYNAFLDVLATCTNDLPEGEQPAFYCNPYTGSVMRIDGSPYLISGTAVFARVPS